MGKDLGSVRPPHTFTASRHPRQRVWRLSRAGHIDINATTVTQRATTFASTAPDGAVLLTRRGDNGLEHFFIAEDNPRVEQAALQLAQTVAARADQIVEPEPLFDPRKAAVMVFNTGSRVGRETQAGADLSQVSVMLATALKYGEWVAVVFRRPKQTEVRRHIRWLKYQLDGVRTHHSAQTGAIII